MVVPATCPFRRVAREAAAAEPAGVDAALRRHGHGPAAAEAEAAGGGGGGLVRVLGRRGVAASGGPADLHQPFREQDGLVVPATFAAREAAARQPDLENRPTRSVVMNEVIIGQGKMLGSDDTARNRR